MLSYAHGDLADPGNSSIWKDLNDLPGRYAAPLGAVWLTYVDAVAVGCGALAPTANTGQAEMKRIYVIPEFRGRGLGHALANVIIAKARSLGYKQLALSTWSHNTAGLALYGALGFIEIPAFKEHPGQDLVFMGLRL